MITSSIPVSSLEGCTQLPCKELCTSYIESPGTCVVGSVVESY